MNDSRTMLVEYAEHGSEAAFRELVSHYLDLVYSTALRLTGPNTQLAEDVTQTVFIDLARTARNLPRNVMLGGWLHRHTCFVASKTLRAERRRQARERKAMEMNLPPDSSESGLSQAEALLDEAINSLGAEDRTAILLRFFEQQDFRAVGLALGSSEEAARKRVNRALEKLHAALQRGGVTLSAAALGTMLATGVVTAAPAALAASVAGTALASAAAGGVSLTCLKILMMTKVKLGLLSALVVAGLLTPWVVQHNANTKLRRANLVLQDQLDRATGENQRLTQQLAQERRAQSNANEQSSELLRLRGEVSRLRAEAQARAVGPNSFLASAATPTEQARSLAGRVQALKQMLNQKPEMNIPELQFASERDWLEAAAEVTTGSDTDLRRALGGLRTLAKNKVAYVMMNALQEYLQANDRQLPSELAELKPYCKRPVSDALLARYRLTATGSARDLKLGKFVIEEAGYVDEPFDTLNKIAPGTFSLSAPNGKFGVPHQFGFALQVDEEETAGPEAEKQLNQLLDQ